MKYWAVTWFSPSFQFRIELCMSKWGNSVRLISIYSDSDDGFYPKCYTLLPPQNNRLYSIFELYKIWDNTPAHLIANCSKSFQRKYEK